MLALVLSGGGLFGAWQAGAWSVLADRITPDLIVGASVGSLNGYVIASGGTPAELAAMWLDPAFARFADLPSNIRRMMARYTQAFSAHGVTVSQVLLTADDLMRRTQHSNAYRALDRLLNLGVVPVVNENDTVATHEIRFGDNDRLAALVAHLVRADALVLLSDVDALYDGPPAKGAKRIPLVTGPADLEGVTIGKAGKAGVGTGGMMTKVEAASIAAGSGIHALVTSTANAAAALAGEDVGTWFAVNAGRKPVRLLWLAHLASVRGRLVLDDGAVRAVRDRHTSLLPAGISSVTGAFEAGDPVEMVAGDGTVIARGLVNYSAEELPRMLGRSTKELAKELGSGYDRVVVHVDDLVLVPSAGSTKLGA